ncbi:CheR family methyltransferase [Pseudokineococcus sp. 1T1Z-3]|uniref:CheR family methyltransferase n=1 Tax=Pseudokineococcus sp. 1T1Z-3 TaxID=3132745 RepID=UPI0030963D7C
MSIARPETRTSGGGEIAPDSLAWVCAVVREECGVVLDASKDYLVLSRLRPLATREGVTVQQLVDRLRRSGRGEQRQLVEAMTTNETSWFRDGEPFHHLRDVALPTLAEARRGVRQLRVWSAACSTGQEPYGLAMLMADAPALADFRVEVVATDVDRTALATAREATYSQTEVGRGLPADMVARYLERVGLRWRVKEDVRRRVRLGEGNLLAPAGADPRPFDIIFCRNVLIYFDPADRRAVLERLHRSLAPDGLLVLGAGENAVTPGDTRWARIGSPRSALFRPIGEGGGPGVGPGSGPGSGTGRVLAAPAPERRPAPLARPGVRVPPTGGQPTGGRPAGAPSTGAPAAAPAGASSAVRRPSLERPAPPSRPSPAGGAPSQARTSPVSGPSSAAPALARPLPPARVARTGLAQRLSGLGAARAELEAASERAPLARPQTRWAGASPLPAASSARAPLARPVARRPGAPPERPTARPPRPTTPISGGEP